MKETLQQRLPWTKSPLICNAPMGGIATAPLAVAVTKASGLGQIGAVDDMSALDERLAEAERQLERQDGLLPIGVGFLAFISKLEDAARVMEKYKPAVIWLFAAVDNADYKTWTEKMRAVSPGSMIWVQVGSVQDAVAVARDAKPDALCVQGSDAGGHGLEKGAGIISLLPEISDALDEAQLSVHLLAAGGIADGRGVAAALTLGADGVVMGTRFLPAQETSLHAVYKDAIMAASDGGQTTIRAKLFDELRGPNIWPEQMDGRSIVMESWNDHLNGIELDKIRESFSQVAKDETRGYGVRGKGRAAMWAGTGVGLVTKRKPAAEIVEEVRNEALDCLRKAEMKITGLAN